MLSLQNGKGKTPKEQTFTFALKIFMRFIFPQPPSHSLKGFSPKAASQDAHSKMALPHLWPLRSACLWEAGLKKKEEKTSVWALWYPCLSVCLCVHIYEHMSCVHVCTRVHVCVHVSCVYMCVHVCVWRAEIKVRCLLQSVCTFFFKYRLFYGTWNSKFG